MWIVYVRSDTDWAIKILNWFNELSDKIKNLVYPKYKKAVNTMVTDNRFYSVDEYFESNVSELF